MLLEGECLKIKYGHPERVQPDSGQAHLHPKNPYCPPHPFNNPLLSIHTLDKRESILRGSGDALKN